MRRLADEKPRKVCSDPVHFVASLCTDPLNGLPAIEADVLTGILRPVGVLQQPRKTPGPQRFLGSATRSTNAGRYGGQPAGLSREYPVALFKSEAPI